MTRRMTGRMMDAEAKALRVLAKEPGHAYAVGRETGIDRSTMTRTLKRLESQRLVRGKWDTSEGRQGPPRRIYTLTAKGRRELVKLRD